MLPVLVTSYVDIENVLNISESDFEKGWIDYVKGKILIIWKIRGHTYKLLLV